MTKQSDAWEARQRQRREAQWIAECRRVRIRDYARAMFGTWSRDHPECLCHAIEGCQDRRCRAVQAYCRRPRCGPNSYQYGPLYALWAILDYFQAMIDGHGEAAAEFGKRFAHRRSQSDAGPDHV